ncbi:MAG: bifunctional shikimate kinase/3-dehydroquinate synthase, partial [Chloroflexi bacterium]|nr:bifunctional shikimate kinase/3-dehydroquinate synthase [Chloroflexota bacterium]
MIADGRNLVVTGMMGSGKSEVGKRLAQLLRRRFVDTDALIEAREGCTVAQVFAAAGEAHFRRLEVDLCRELGRKRRLVIATGGGTLMSDECRALLGRQGLVACLRADPRTLAQRISDRGTRPLLAGQPLEEALTRLWQERRNAYALAPLQVPTDGRTPEEVAQAIVAAPPLLEARLGSGPDTPSCFWLGLDSFGRLPGRLALPPSRRVFLVADGGVPPFWARLVQMAWEEAGCRVTVARLALGEERKTLATARGLYRRFAQAQLDRGSLVVALGGGVASDVAGFAAATYMRGLPWAALPSTLLAAVDAAVGGKTAVNLPQGKNLVGTFWPPSGVAADPALFYTLPRQEVLGGLAEILKAGVIGSPPLFAHLEAAGLDDLLWVVMEAMSVKAAIVASDPREEGRRALLNLGHTFGHAYEWLSGYRLPHGAAVAAGLAASAQLGLVLGLTGEAFVRRLLRVLGGLGLPTRPPQAWPAGEVWQAMQRDKKRLGAKLRFVVPLEV